MPVEYGEGKTYVFIFFGTANVSLPIGHRGGATSDSLRPPASIDEQCKYFRKLGGCRMGDTCAYQHSSYRTDENWRRSVHERQQHTNLDVDRRVSEEKDDSSVSGSSVNGESDSSSDSDEVWSPMGSRMLARSILADSVDGGILGVVLHEAHRYTPSGSEAKSDSEYERFWSSPDLDEDEGIHFYGAPGGFRAQESKEAADWRFAVASTIEFEERCCGDDEAPIVCAQEKPSSSQHCSKPREICRFFLDGKCTRGVQCLYAHPVEAAEAKELYTEQEADDKAPSECGICLEIVTDKFGILTGCNHMFCLSCLGKWRKKGKDAFRRAVPAVRGCPICRKPSFFIIPSATFVTGKKKHNLIETYKDNLAKIPCRNFRYHNPNGCRFGSSCFFLHQGPQV